MRFLLLRERQTKKIYKRCYSINSKTQKIRDKSLLNTKSPKHQFVYIFILIYIAVNSRFYFSKGGGAAKNPNCGICEGPGGPAAAPPTPCEMKGAFCCGAAVL